MEKHESVYSLYRYHGLQYVTIGKRYANSFFIISHPYVRTYKPYLFQIVSLIVLGMARKTLIQRVHDRVWVCALCG